MKCPKCRCETFFVKDPDDEYNYFQFSCVDGEIEFASEVDASEVPEVHSETEAYCVQCAWHGRFDVLNKPAE